MITLLFNTVVTRGPWTTTKSTRVNIIGLDEIETLFQTIEICEINFKKLSLVCKLSPMTDQDTKCLFLKDETSAIISFRALSLSNLKEAIKERVVDGPPVESLIPNKAEITIKFL